VRRLLVSRGICVVLCLLGLGTACGGSSGDACRLTTDCPNGELCVGLDDPPVCGRAPMAGCTTDVACPSAQRCHAIFDSCSPTGVGAMCGPPCTATSCGSGFQCNSDMACEPTPCGSNHPCPSYQHCDPSTADDKSGPVYQETDGCGDVECMSDSDCAAGEACVNGFCQTAPGTCKAATAAP
jgi:hypothetical protein